MSSLGPHLPPHLTKRKRSLSSVDPPTSPPHKILATSNPDELSINSDSEDDYGPSKPNTKSSPPRKVVGPSLPPTKNPDQLDLDESSDDDNYGPSAPSTTDAKPTSPQAAAPKRRILGPAPPPGPLSELPSHSATHDSPSDSDSDYGPSLPPAPGTAAYTTSQTSAFDTTATPQEAAAPKAQRAEWMVVPPTSSSRGVDPTKLKNRKFASGKGAKAPSEKSGISAIWTETPDEKRQRLEDEILGRREAATSSRASSSSTAQASGKTESREEQETARRIREFNERARGRSLYAEHEERKGREIREKEDEDDPSKRGFDRERDMALGGRLGNGEKRELLAKARDFGERFQRGKYL